MSLFDLLSVQRPGEVSVRMFPADPGPAIRQRGIRRQRVPIRACAVVANGIAYAECLTVALVRRGAIYGLLAKDDYIGRENRPLATTRRFSPRTEKTEG